MSRERTTARTKWRQNCSYLWMLVWRSQQPQTPFTKFPLIVQGMTNSGNSNNTMSAPQHGEGVTNKKYVESMMNLALLDPPRWGWPALGPVVDLLTPHERARRKGSKPAKKSAKKKKRGRPVGCNNSGNNNFFATPAAATLKPPPNSSEVPTTNETSAIPVATGIEAASDTNGGKESTASPFTATPDEKAATKMDGDQNNSQTDVNKQNETGPRSSSGENAGGGEAVDTGTGNDASKDGSAPSKPTDSKTGDEKVARPPEQQKSSAASIMSTETGEIIEGAVATVDPNNKDSKASQESSEAVQNSITLAQLAQEAPATTPAAAETASATEQTQPTEEKQPSEPEIEIFEEGPDPYDKRVKTRALSEKGLDIYAYHRGREGMEPRDPATGELVCDVQPTDTNYKLDEPRLTLTVTVKFPLVEEEDIKRGNKADWPMYEDVIPWNLGDPETPTPMEFAANTAETFGLSFGQTVDLATTIEMQIMRHLKEHCGYREPVALTDGAGGERISFPPYSISQLYGAVVSQNGVKPGHLLCTVEGPGSKGKPRSTGRAPLLSGHGTSGRRNSLSGSSTARGQSRPPPILYEEDEVIEELYVEEVEKRMVNISKRSVEAKSPNIPGPLGHIELRDNWVCHICHKRNKLVGIFACGHSTHSYCANHLRDRLGLPVRKLSDKVTFDHCPICSVTCKCSKCKRRLKALACELKRLSIEQGVDAAKTEFDNIKNAYTRPIAYGKGKPHRRSSDASFATDVSSTINSQPDKGVQPFKSKAGGRNSGDGLIQVKKVAVTEFPREILPKGNVDLDPGTNEDYLTIYTVDGSYLKEEDAPPVPSKPNTIIDPAAVPEDGNVDYCQHCRLPGSLVCCDLCPRAYHSDCRKEGDDGKDLENGRWECHKCVRERHGLPEYKLTGSESQDKFLKAYENLKTVEGDDLTALSVLCKMHEMVSKLMKSDFGYIFGLPVSSDDYPDYPKVVKNPMDLGAVATRLVNGYYKKFFSSEQPWAQVHLAVLRDIELIWHNCMLFNHRGSAVYRMAKVTRRLMIGMKRQSLDRDLSPITKEKIDTYVKDLERNREKIAKAKKRPVSRQQIVAKGHGGVPKKVAVLDPDTGMVVKIYSTIKNAALAAGYMSGRRKHKSEFPLVNYHTVKTLISRSAENPNATLFGYRWLDYDTLRDCGVWFSLPDEAEEPVVIEMTHGDAIYIFRSVDEALSCPRIPSLLSGDVVRKGKLRKDLRQLKEGGDSVSCSGVRWRRLKPLARNTSLIDTEITLAPFYAGGEERKSSYQSEYLPESVTIVKEDVTIRRALAGFETASAAFADWEVSCKSCPTMSASEITRSQFDTYYLNGERNVDGIMWKTFEKKTPQPISMSAAKEPKHTVSVLADKTKAGDTANKLKQASTDVAPTMDDAEQTEAKATAGDSEEEFASAAGSDMAHEDGSNGESNQATDTAKSEHSENPNGVTEEVSEGEEDDDDDDENRSRKKRRLV